MTHYWQFSDNELHAFVDDEMDVDSRHRLLTAMEQDEGLRARVCELQRGKEWITIAFGDAEPPQRPVQGRPARHRFCRSSRLNRGMVAASLLLVVAFALGWVVRSERAVLETVALEDIQASQYRVVLHIDESSPAKFEEVLGQAESLLGLYRDKGIQVELLANSGGIELLQADNTGYVQRVNRIVRANPNLTLIACSNALERLREKGVEPKLIEGTHSDESAIDHVIRRLREGWSYIKV